MLPKGTVKDFGWAVRCGAQARGLITQHLLSLVLAEPQPRPFYALPATSAPSPAFGRLGAFLPHPPEAWCLFATPLAGRVGL